MFPDGVAEAVNAVGNVLGNARESFGVRAGGGVSPTSGSPTTLAAAFFGSGQTVSASNNQSNVLAGFSSALGEQDAAANAHVQSVLASQNAGIGQLDDAITGTQAKVTSLAPATNTHGGLLGLVDALVQGLEQAWQAMTNGNADASKHTAGQAQLAANYSGLISSPGGGVAQPATLTSMAGLSTGTMATTVATQPAMTATQVWMPASMAAASTAAAAQAATAQQAASTTAQPATPATATSATKTVPSNVQNAINRATQYINKVPYVWGGGNANGPTGHAANGKPGFDCSGLTLYAYAPYVALPHNANAQSAHGTVVARQDIQPGDLIFSMKDEEGPKTGWGHVQMAIGYGANSPVVEAPHTGLDVQKSSIESGAILIKRLLH